MYNSQIIKNQVKKFNAENVLVNGERVDIQIEVRHDDNCGNGHNSFSITGTYYRAGAPRNDRNMVGAGCIHDVISQGMPELIPLIKYHNCTTDEPLYYLSNTLYHAHDADYDGYRKGEYTAYTLSVIANVNKDNSYEVIYKSDGMYVNRQDNPNLITVNEREKSKVAAKVNNIKTELSPQIVKEWEEWSIREGKEIELEAARISAVWPHATLEQLQSEATLVNRLPTLMKEFKSYVEALGLVW